MASVRWDGVRTSTVAHRLHGTGLLSGRYSTLTGNNLVTEICMDANTNNFYDESCCSAKTIDVKSSALYLVHGE